MISRIIAMASIWVLILTLVGPQNVSLAKSLTTAPSESSGSEERVDRGKGGGVAGRGGGVADGGGGDAIRCSDGRLYSLDYIQTQTRTENLADEVLRARTALEILGHIAKVLDMKLPRLAASLRDFMRLNENEFDQTTKRLWTSGVHPLFDLPDEAKLRLPRGCLQADGKMNLYQAVIRRAHGDAIEYDYDPEIRDELERTAATQLSFLYVHEWLRDFTDDPITIQKLNRILHGADWLKATPEQLVRKFAEKGAPLPSHLTLNPSEARAAQEKANKFRELERMMTKGQKLLTESETNPCGPTKYSRSKRSPEKELAEMAHWVLSFYEDLSDLDPKINVYADYETLDKFHDIASKNARNAQCPQ